MCGGTRRLVCFSTTSIFGKTDTRNTHEQTVVNKLTTAERHIDEVCMASGVGLMILCSMLIDGAAGQDFGDAPHGFREGGVADLFGAQVRPGGCAVRPRAKSVGSSREAGSPPTAPLLRPAGTAWHPTRRTVPPRRPVPMLAPVLAA